jgi:CRP-like cAMP-binding protein
LEEQGAFAALLLEGMVLEQLRIGDQVGLRLLGPGDVVTADSGAESTLIDTSQVRVVAGTRMALLGRELLLASHRWPALVRGLHLRMAQQSERLATQLVICQLPRVDQRLLGLMWLLAESWGRVTPSGTTLPLRLTHDVLGALIGARRPTVTLALRDLSERGAIARQQTGWLLLEAPPGASQSVENLRSPGLIDDAQPGWIDSRATGRTDVPAADVFAQLTARLATLRERHTIDRAAFDERLRTWAGTRERCRQSRVRVARDRLNRRRSRSS